MEEMSPASPAGHRAGTRKRNLIIISSMVPIVALFVLLGWAVARTGGTPGGFGINSRFGEIPVEHRLAPEFVKEDLNGETISLAGLRGKVVMIDFWSSWCPPAGGKHLHWPRCVESTRGKISSSLA